MKIPYVGETKFIDNAVRDDLGIKYILLSEGITHYRISGPAAGSTIVLIHGIGGPMGSFDALAKSLSDRGFRVLQYDLFGRGYSDRPSITYDLELFVSQLKELLDNLNMIAPFTLVGWSLGAMIAASFAAKYPTNVDRLVFIAPAGIEVNLPPIARVAMIPGLGELIMALLGRRIVLRNLLEGMTDKTLVAKFLKMISDQMQYQGYLQSFLSTLRECGYQDISETYQNVAKHDLSACLITGSQDPSIPRSVRSRLKELIPGMLHEEVLNTGHFPHFERPVEVSNLIEGFIKREKVLG